MTYRTYRFCFSELLKVCFLTTVRTAATRTAQSLLVLVFRVFSERESSLQQFAKGRRARRHALRETEILHGCEFIVRQENLQAVLPTCHVPLQIRGACGLQEEQVLLHLNLT